MRRLIIFFLGLMLISQGFAQENEFTLGGQIRSRAEDRHGAFFPLGGEGDEREPSFFINERARLSMEYKRDKISMGISAQHVGVWGQDPQVDMVGDRFMLNEAWASLRSANGLFLKFGRQSLVYDDERILGGLDWHVSGRFHDALKMGFENSQNKFHVVLAFNQVGERNNNSLANSGTYYPLVDQGVAQPYKTMQTLWYQYIANKTFNASFLMMNLGLQVAPTDTEDASVKFNQTFGTNLTFAPGSFKLLGTFYLQTGERRVQTSDQTIAAFMWALNASYAVNPKLSFMAATDYLSGNDGKDAEKFKAFNVLYGTHHKFYGTMDYFYASPFLGGANPGLWDKQLGISCKPAPVITLALNYHHFSTTTDVLKGEEKLKRSMGSEWDFQFTWNAMKDVTLMGGYSSFFGNDTMKALKGGDLSQWQGWAWVSLNINPKLLITKW